MLAVPVVGRVVGNGLGWEPYRLVDADGQVVDAVSVFRSELVDQSSTSVIQGWMPGCG